MRPPIDEQELRAMLAEADVTVDDAILPSLLIGVQPMRVAACGQRGPASHLAAAGAV